MVGIYLSSVREQQRLRRHWSTSAAGIAAITVQSYGALVAAATPALWWRLGEGSGTTAADSGSGGNPGTLTGGATFASAGVSVPAVPGYAGLGEGIDLSAASVSDVRKTGMAATVMSTNNPAGAFTFVIWVAGSAGASQYIASNVNDPAIIYQFVSDTVEFFSLSYAGTNPRTGSGISLPAADTTTPHMIVYRYNNGQWTGFKNGAKVFDVARSFNITPTTNLYLGSDSGTSYSNCRVWDQQTYTRALSDAEIAAMYAARDVV